MKNLKISILSLSMGLFIAACNNCGTKSMSSSDSTSATTTVATPAATTPAVTTDTPAAPATGTAAASGTSNGSGSGNVTTTTTTKTTERKAHGGAAAKGDGRDHSDNSLSSGTDNVERTKDANGNTIVRPVNNPPKGTFGNSVNQDTH